MLEWQTRVIEDLSPFCDLGEHPVTLDASAYRIQLSWVRGGILRESEIRLDGEELRIRIDAEEITFSKFLASPAMANLKFLADQINRLANVRRRDSRIEIDRRGSVISSDWYVDPKVRYSKLTGGTPEQALDELPRIMSSTQRGDFTDIYFITAHAGQGKSWMLRNVCRTQALRYLNGQADSIAFMIDAQGKGLSKLPEVLSKELNELRVNIPYEAIFSLVREGLMTLIIDGFDELIGARGTYSDAFYSLNTFLERLDGRGRVIAAVRSTYFQHEYLSNPVVLSGALGRDRTIQLELVAWTSIEREQFLEKVRESAPDRLYSESVAERFRGIVETDHARLLTRPLFCRDIILALLRDRTVDLTGSMLELLDTVVTGNIDREVVEKLVDESGASILGQAQLRDYFYELAEEMWALETRELDLPAARTILDLLLEDWGMDPASEESRIARDRVGQMPFLESGDPGVRTVSFEHELVFAYFVSRGLSRAISGGSNTSVSMLAKARVSEDQADLVIQTCVRESLDFERTLANISEIAGQRNSRAGQVQENCGTLAAALLRNWSKATPQISGVQVSDLVFDGVGLTDLNLADTAWVRCVFSGVDFSRSTIEGQFSDCAVLSAAVSDSTRLRVTGLPADDPISVLESREGEATHTVYESSRKAELYRAIGLWQTDQEVAERFDIDEDTLRVIQGLCRAFEEMNPIGDRHDRFATQVFRTPQWPRVRSSLLRTGLLKEDPPRQTSGPRQNFYRRSFSVGSLLAGLTAVSDDVRIEEFWRDLDRAKRPTSRSSRDSRPS